MESNKNGFDAISETRINCISSGICSETVHMQVVVGLKGWQGYMAIFTAELQFKVFSDVSVLLIKYGANTE